MSDHTNKPGKSALKKKLHEIIFEADTPPGKAFDVGLILTILLSVLVVMLESIAGIRQEYGPVLRTMEWGFTIAFTIEYLLRLYCVGRPLQYAGSFYGIVDLLAIIPTYLSVILPGTQYLLVIRTIRILRVFRVLKLVQYWSEARILSRALYASRRKIFVCTPSHPSQDDECARTILEKLMRRAYRRPVEEEDLEGFGKSENPPVRAPFSPDVVGGVVVRRIGHAR